jgi:hypothetical protein
MLFSKQTQINLLTTFEHRSAQQHSATYDLASTALAQELQAESPLTTSRKS